MTTEEWERNRKRVIKEIKDFIKNKASEENLDEIALALKEYDDEYGVECITHLNFYKEEEK